MKAFQKFNRFPLGAIKAEGFLKEQMLIGKEGMAGNLYKLEPEMIEAPYLRDFNVPAWSKTEATGWGAEISGNYWTGYIQHAFTLNDAQMIETATNWVDGVLKRQAADGYLGTYPEKSDIADRYEDYNAWGTACGMRALLAFYEATGREDVLDAVYKCMLWFVKEWAGDRKTTYAGPFITEIMIEVYRHTGDESLVDFAEDYQRYLCENDIFANSYKSMLEEEFHYNSNHAAGIGTNTRLPALLYSVTGKKEYLDATEKRIADVRKNSMHITGGAVSMAEFLGPVSSIAESEYCSFTVYNSMYSHLSYITGDAKYGEYMEEVFYNAAQGARKKDEKAIAYLSAPNQVYATMDSSNGMRDDQVYAPCFPVSCCPVNSVVIVPEFVRGMLLEGDNDSVCVMAYGPCSLNYKDIALKVNTMYPFRNKAELEFMCSKEFEVKLRIPSWAKGFKVKINGKPVEEAKAADSFVTVEKSWSTGDKLEIEFDAKIEVVTIDDSNASGKYPLAVKYGALIYSYHVPEIWEPTEGRPMTKLPDGWSWFNVNPHYDMPDVADIHERNGMLKHAFSWNIALDETISEKDFSIEEIEDAGYVWANAPIRLHTNCYKAPDMWAPYQCKTFEPYGKYQRVTAKLPLVLEPYGCTNLRITYFPKADPNCIDNIK